MINLFLIGYLLPLILALSILAFFEKDIVTVKDLLNCYVAYVIPILNIFFLFLIIIHFIVRQFKLIISKIRFKQDFLNYKLKKFGSLK